LRPRTLLKKIKDKLISYRWKAIVVNSILGDNIFISKNSFISNSLIDDFTSVGRNTTIVHTKIGKYCSISWNVTIGATQHPFERISTHAFPYIKRFGFTTTDNRFVSQTIVGNDVWFGANAIVMPNVKIGNGAIIGAGAIVTKDVPDYAIVAGVPAKIIRYRFSEETINKLVNLKWWDLNVATIKQNIALWKKDLDNDALIRLEQLCKS